MNTDTPTPETDALWEAWADEKLPNGQFRYGPKDLADHARKLERERDELKSLLTKKQGAVTISRNGYVQELERERDEAREQRDELAESILNLSHPNCVMLISERDVAREQLTIKCEQLEQQRNALCSFINREMGMSANDLRISELKRILENDQDQERP
jgi:hypothetical protein